MKKYICIHGHFYQPPRENAWLEAIEKQESASPYHDWNERISAECYGPNGASRMLNEEQKIINIVNNYTNISYNFGPTLLSWLEKHDPDAYHNICLLYTSPSPRDRTRSRMPSSALKKKTQN